MSQGAQHLGVRRVDGNPELGISFRDAMRDYESLPERAPKCDSIKVSAAKKRHSGKNAEVRIFQKCIHDCDHRCSDFFSLADPAVSFRYP